MGLRDRVLSIKRDKLSREAKLAIYYLDITTYLATNGVSGIKSDRMQEVWRSNFSYMRWSAYKDLLEDKDYFTLTNGYYNAKLLSIYSINKAKKRKVEKKPKKEEPKKVERYFV